MHQEKIKIGWASVSITPDRPIFLVGQMYYRVSKYVHDPITATALALENGKSQSIIVSCDMPIISSSLVEMLRNKIDGYHGINSDMISVSATHTHNSSNFSNDIHREQFLNIIGEDKILQMENIPENMLVGEELKAFWIMKVSSIIKEAWDSREFGGISFAHDYAPVAFNRRPLFGENQRNTISKMYGDCSRNDFQGFEGTFDHSTDMIFTWDQNNEITGILVNVPCPSQVMELHKFISADYWYYSRNVIREKFGKNIFILPICGAAGDQNPIDLVRVSKNNKLELKMWNAQAEEVWCNYDLAEECENIGNRIADSVFRGYKKARNKIQYRIEFYNELHLLKLPIRTIEKEEYMKAKNEIEAFCAKFSSSNRMNSYDQVSLFNPIGYIERWKLQNKTQKYEFNCHILRLGTNVVATVPFELFVDYAFQIKAKVNADQVFIFQLTDDTGGYLPTKKAIAGGSYSSKPTSTLVGPEGGEVLVDSIIDNFNRIMEKK